MTQSVNSLHALRLVTDRPSLNFAYTVDPREGSGAMDYLQTYADLAVWTACTGIVSRKQVLRGLCAAREPEVHTLDRHSRMRGGCLSTRARVAAGAGAAWRVVATAPKRGVTRVERIRTSRQ